ncbi:HAMP domain-containing protein [Photobacterium profundum]|uniref:ATP-binding protein n=1 Tax=Photobacterium profundum TaxID=74109 RepID=UPI0002EA2C97|nr:ATP-binding protein [Photobacterium profundum]PSV56883.1 HAMP domain-containing protein [Photobacterium profundum]
MRRIYLESFLGLILLFFLSLVGYEVVIYQLNTDYDYVLKGYEASAYQDLVNIIADTQGKDVAVQAVQDYANKTRRILTIYPFDKAPDAISDAFSRQPYARLYHDDEQVLWFLINQSSDIYSMDVNSDAPLIKRIDFDDNIVWLFFLSGFALYCILLMYFLSRRVRALEKVTLAFANGDFTARASLKGSKKVGSLNQSFNHMADKISGLITSNRALTNAVAHELRTPIFRVQWQAEILADTSLELQQQAGVASIIEDTEEMEMMVDELLYYARVERTDTDLNLQLLPINEWLSEQLVRWNKETAVDIEVTLLTSESQLMADSHLLKRALDNLVRNGCRFAKQSVHIILIEKEQALCIEVHDDGNGVDEKHWTHLFDAFYSADSARNKKKSGHGLGLAIVKQIAERHQAIVSIKHSPLGGACFQITIPNTI